MLSADMILAGLTAIANEWRGLAMAWHAGLLVFLLTIAARRRLSTRMLGGLSAMPLLSVSLLAWWAGNPFNGTIFAILSAALLASTWTEAASARHTSFGGVVLGALLVAFGGTYPHFLDTDSWTTYLYASPFGLVPCPTLSVVIGATLMFETTAPVRTRVALILAGVLYGTVGVFGLGVALDWGLLIGSALLAVTLPVLHRERRSVRPTAVERSRHLPGDDLIARPGGSLTHAVTIDGAPRSVWPWLVQMGAGSRAGWYSYDALDNGRQPSATRLVPALQDIGIGTVFPALPGMTDGFTVLSFEPDRFLALGWLDPHGTPLVTWVFLLEDRGNKTRLIVRARGRQDYRFRGLPSGLSKLVIRLVHFVMQRRQLLGIARRVESFALDDAVPVAQPETSRT